MTTILAADIGGTKTLLQLSQYDAGRYRLLCERNYASQDYATFDAVLTAFLADAGRVPIDHACFAVAGPVAASGASARVTNLPWSLERDRLTADFALTHVYLINDFHAVAVAIDTLQADELMTLQVGRAEPQGPQLVVGAGTGLGVAIRVWNGQRYQVLASEAGHAGFAPADEQQRQLLAYVATQQPVVSREHVLSGSGLVTIYRFVCQLQQCTPGDLDAGMISELAGQGDHTCQDSLSLFFRIYGSETANLALIALPFGGIYIAGGIAAKNIDALARSEFVSAFCTKSKMGPLLKDMPIHVIKNQSVGLLGARWHASHQQG